MKRLTLVFALVPCLSPPAFADLAGSPISGGGSGAWGSITGTLSEQADLQGELGAKAPTASPTFTGTPTVNEDIPLYFGQTSGTRFGLSRNSTTGQWVFSTEQTDAAMTDTNAIFKFVVNAAGGTLDAGQYIFQVLDYQTSKLYLDQAGNLVITGEFTGAGFNSTCSPTDNTCRTNVADDGNPATGVEGDHYYNRTTQIPKWYDGASWQDALTSGSTSALSFATTGTLSGGIVVLDNVTSPTAAQMYGSLNIVSGAGTRTLPAAAAGMSTCILSVSAAAVSVDVDAADIIYLNGVALDAGDKVTSASAAGNFICLVSSGTTNWYTLGRSGTWTDGGP